VRILATLVRPDAGEATVGGYDVLRQPDRVRGLVALAGHVALDGEMTGIKNLLAIAGRLAVPGSDAERRARELVDRFELGDAAGRKVKTYSTGMRRRLDLAVSLMGRPEVLLLDEPTTGLDPGSRDDVWRLVRGIAADGMTVLFTTRQLDEADQLATEIAVIDRGLLTASGTPARLKAEVGGRTLDVRPAAPTDLPAVRAVVSRVTGAAPRPTVDPGLVSAPAEDPGVVDEVMSWLQEAGIPVTEIGLRLASLAEVFLALTGRQAVDPAARMA
jgi:oleandomycin transport system ATP-binding protein